MQTQEHAKRFHRNDVWLAAACLGKVQAHIETLSIDEDNAAAQSDWNRKNHKETCFSKERASKCSAVDANSSKCADTGFRDRNLSKER